MTKRNRLNDTRRQRHVKHEQQNGVLFVTDRRRQTPKGVSSATEASGTSGEVIGQQQRPGGDSEGTGSGDEEPRDPGGATRPLRGRGQSRWPSADKTIMEEATAGTVIERGQRKVRNKTGRYETQYRVEYQDRPGGPVVPAWLTAQQFETLFDQGKIGDDLQAGDGVWTNVTTHL
ncbi:hypothetical protein P3T76_015115 [Phytophthora citrophthora]|uniref:Uncharacterized protein n=1 Tax=Phytophthora citrophthora TaxID=4793 RepID=A0AAD9LAI3_9STRA|nr:hypothetical protein P3T76_015115 [Phytophthora citrophthora]